MEYSAAQPRGVGRMGDDIEVGGLLRSTAGPADDMAHASRSIQDPVAQGISIGERGIHAVAGWLAWEPGRADRVFILWCVLAPTRTLLAPPAHRARSSEYSSCVVCRL